MVCCLNPDCSNPQNSPQTRFCQSCGEAMVPLLLNRFKVTKVLGRGGFGKTYLAEDTHKLNESCVVKQLVPNTQGTWAKNKAIELFKQEAQQLQQLGEHHHIPSLYAYFEQDGYLYLVQQFIEGQNLLLELLSVLDFIHKNGVIHRDIKLENIMRRQASTRVGKRGDLVLIDFGVSKQLSSTVLTTTMGTMIGSHGYAPLEQMQGGKAYPASDLFSLGVTCFHLLTNIHPHTLWIDEGYSWTNNWRSHLPNKVSGDLVRVMDKLLLKDVEQRYQSAEEVIKDLPDSVILPIPSPTLPSPSPLISLKLDKKLLTGVAIVLIGFLGYEFFDSVSLLITNTSTLNLSWENTTFLDTLNGHEHYVRSVAFSPDGKILASGSFDTTIKLWNVATKKEITTLTGHLDKVTSVAFSPNGKILASGSSDKTIKLWNVETKAEIVTLHENSQTIWSVAFSPNGKTLASGNNDSTIKLWDLETEKEITTLKGHKDIIYSITFSPDGKILASGSQDKQIKLWNVETNREITTLSGHLGYVDSVVFSPDGKTLASGSADQTIKLWNLKTRDLIHTLSGHSNTVYCLVFSVDGETLASGSQDRTIKLWNMETKRETTTLTGHAFSIYSLAFSPDGKTLASGSSDNTTKLWHLPETR